VGLSSSAALQSIRLFPFENYWWFYLGFTLLVIALLALDLGVFHRKAHAVGMKEATVWALIWVALAVAFNYGLYHYALWRFPQVEQLMEIPGFDPVRAARQVGLEFFTGYILEKSLSVDNMFVFVVVFRYFAIPREYQHRILFFGILGALVFRGIFIAAGSYLIQFSWVIIVFGLFLIFTGVKMCFAHDEGVHPERNFIIRLFRRWMPVTSVISGQRFTLIENGRRVATPLLVCLLFLESTDIVFAVDSVPAIFAVTREPMIVYTSNVAAILGLRSLYFLLAGAVHLFHMLKYGLSIVLIFVGLKMVWLNKLFGGHFPITLSLGIILGVIAASIVLSLVFPKKAPVEDNGGV
jgi:tellurite resistance protein TerC